MRKLFTWLVLLGFTSSLIGCGSPAPPVEEAPPPTEEEMQENMEMGDIDALDEALPEEGEEAEGEEPPA